MLVGGEGSKVGEDPMHLTIFYMRCVYEVPAQQRGWRWIVSKRRCMALRPWLQGIGE